VYFEEFSITKPDNPGIKREIEILFYGPSLQAPITRLQKPATPVFSSEFAKIAA
jgi:hypothetical protein